MEGGKESNEKCLSVLCAKDGWEALITGDMPAEEEALLAAREELPDAEVLVAGHHGSQYATGEKLLAAVTPERVVISVGDNAYGHPAPETLERIQAAGGGGLPHRLARRGDGACPVRKRPAPREFPQGGDKWQKKNDKAAGQEAYRRLKKDISQGTIGSLYLFHGRRPTSGTTTWTR